MRAYGKLAPTFWTRGTGKDLRGDTSAQVVAMYLMSAPTSNMIGLYYLPVSTISHDTGIPLEGASKALRRVSEGGLCTYDETSETVFVHTMAPRQLGLEDEERLSAKDNRVKAIVKMMRECGCASLLQEFYETHRERLCLPAPWWEAPSKALASPFEGPPKGSDEPIQSSTDPLRSQDQDQDQDQEHDLSEGQTPAAPADVPALTLNGEPGKPAKQKKLPLSKPSDPTAEAMGLWRKLWGETYSGSSYVDPPGEFKQLRELVAKASEIAKTSAPNETDGTSKLIAHWFKSYLADADSNGFLASKRHGLRWLVQEITKYGTPWDQEPASSVFAKSTTEGPTHYACAAHRPLRLTPDPVPPTLAEIEAADAIVREMR